MTFLAHITSVEIPSGIILFLLGVASGLLLAWKLPTWLRLRR